MSTASVTGPAVVAIGHEVTTGVSHPPVDIEKMGNGVVMSKNWAGYAVTYASSASTFSTVTGTWTEPTASCPTNAQQDAAFWVGLDGFQSSSTTVEQTGTDSDCNKGSKKKPGGPTYYAWYEFYPQPSTTISKPVSPGDVMTGTVTRSGSSYTLTLTDASKGWTASESGSPGGAQASSAEWIAEAPSICKGSSCKASKLANFGSVTFSNASADSNAINASPFVTEQIIMAKGKKVRAATSGLVGGTGFSIVWRMN
ncbi:MAG: G1 family glutamic endopeptidase [Acidimicrobiales bacterium]